MGSWRRGGWCSYTGCEVVGVDDGLGDVGLLLPPEDGGELLLAADVEEEGEAVVLGILDGGATELLGNFTVGFLDIAVVGGLGLFDVALEGFLLGVDGLEAAGALFVGQGGGQSLILLLQGLNLSRLCIDGGLFGLELLLDVGDGLLAFVGGDYTLLEGDDGDLGGDRLGWGNCGGLGWSWCRSCCRGLGEEGGGCEAGGQSSS